MAAHLISETEVIQVTNPPVLLYGQPGAGKTSLAQTASKCLTLDFDTGAHRSAFRKSVLRFDSWEDVLEAEKAGTFDQFETLNIDTVGTALEYMTTSIINSGQKGVRMGSGSLSMQGWGILKVAFSTWLAGLRQKGKQVIMIAHQKEERDGDARMLRPDIAGGSYSIVMNCADIVGYVSYRSGRRSVSWEPTDSYFAKNGAQLESGPIPDFNERPHFMAELLAKAKANLGNTALASAAVAQAVEGWAERLKAIEGVEALNVVLPELSKLAPVAKAQAWKLITEHAASKGWTFNREAKVFVGPAAPLLDSQPDQSGEMSAVEKLRIQVSEHFERIGTSFATIKSMLHPYNVESVHGLSEAACKDLIGKMVKIPDREAGVEAA